MAEEAATEMAALSVEGEGESKAAKAAAARAADRAAKAEWYAKRIALFEGWKAREDAKVQAAKDAEVPFTVVLPDGNEVAAVRGSTTPMDIALGISKVRRGSSRACGRLLPPRGPHARFLCEIPTVERTRVQPPGARAWVLIKPTPH